ncbi:MAG: tRNA threonylcarbamoyladenosine dehydratase, partial [Clostridia bacterium]|nr:tRNA threonylcarbamoyladenosine dehydratase [Clostridia bacterium]
FSAYDYVVDAIDDVKGKLAIIACAKAAGVPVICAMGAGNKMDPTAFRVADIEKTAVCPLAKVVRIALRKQGIKGVKVVYSEETPAKTAPSADGKAPPTSISFVPPAMGLCLAGAVVNDLINMPRA